VFESLHGLRLVRGSGDSLAGCKWRLEGSRLGLFVSKSSAMVCPRRTIFQQEHDPRLLFGQRTEEDGAGGLDREQWDCRV
jgi:hypothetical protein